MKIAVIGAGGVGGHFGAKLANDGHPVTFVARGPHLKAILQNGPTVLSSHADIDPVNAAKLRDAEDVARALKPLVEQGVVILSLQSGVEKHDIPKARFRANRSSAAVICRPQ